jgi:hypothetical protein
LTIVVAGLLPDRHRRAVSSHSVAARWLKPVADEKTAADEGLTIERKCSGRPVLISQGRFEAAQETMHGSKCQWDASGLLLPHEMAAPARRKLVKRRALSESSTQEERECASGLPASAASPWR